MDRLTHVLFKPFAPLLPWAGLALGLCLLLWVVQTLGVAKAEAERVRLEKAWAVARQELAHHREARKAKQDLKQVWAVLSDEREFGPLALGISEEAKQDRVMLPALSSKIEPTLVSHTSKGVLQGPISGRYEDLRRFIYDLETAEELLFIEDLELSRSTSQQAQTLTFNIKIAAYLRAHAPQSSAPE
jgi:hypothetical protein